MVDGDVLITLAQYGLAGFLAYILWVELRQLNNKMDRMLVLLEICTSYIKAGGGSGKVEERGDTRVER